MAPATSTAFDTSRRGPTYTVDRGTTPSTISAVAGSSTRPWTDEIALGRGGRGSWSSGLRGDWAGGCGFFSGCWSTGSSDLEGGGREGRPGGVVRLELQPQDSDREVREGEATRVAHHGLVRARVVPGQRADGHRLRRH